MPSGKKILWKQIDSEKIEVSVDKNSARGGNAKPIIIKRFIEINEDLFQLLGLWFGDGIRKQWGRENVFGFSNTEIELTKTFLSLSKICLSIPSEQYNCILSLQLSLKDVDEELNSKISRELNIPLENFWRSRINPTRNLLGIDVKINSRLLGFIMTNLSSQTIKLAIGNKSYASRVLQGIIASEANVSVRKEGRLGEISIAAEGENKRNFIRSLLLTLGIKPNKDKTIENQESVCLTGLSNFKIVKEWGLVDLNPTKLKNFEKGLNGFKVEQSRKGELRLKVLQLLAKKSRTRQELGKLLERSPATIKTEALYILEKQGLVEREGIINKARLWKITEKGLNLLRENRALEKLRSR
ncbi:MAG: winged helix-turn-helix domain-containing protein [Candidatus Aenigmatarchaeota archaeon]